MPSYFEMRIQYKPLSVNLAWQGKRFKTPAYKKYEHDILLLLPVIKVDKIEKLKISFVFGFSNIQSDIDNPVKLLIDIFQKKYKFNDSHVWEISLRKEKVDIGKEFIDFTIENLSAVAQN